MKYLLRITSLSLLFIIFLNLSAKGQAVKYLTALREESNPAYLMFLGEDRDLFATTVKGFGSGLLDVYNSRYSFDLIRIGGDAISLSGGIGFAVNKYRFRENLIIEKSMTGEIMAYADTNAAHDYVNTFFGYGKSKLVYGSVYFPLFLNIQSGNIMVSAGVYYDYYLSGKLKRKYKLDGEKTVDKVKNSSFRDFNLNKGKVGVSFSIVNTDVKYGISASYMVTPFFIEDQGPELNEFRIGLFRYMGDFNFGKD